MNRVSVSSLVVMLGVSVSLSLFGANNSSNSKTPAESVTTDAQEDCEKLQHDPFPDLIVEKVLISNGISRSEIPKINVSLDAAAAKIPGQFVLEDNLENEPAATNDPLSDVYSNVSETLDEVKRNAFLEAMKPYITDAQLGLKMFNEINAKRESALEACMGLDGSAKE